MRDESRSRDELLAELADLRRQLAARRPPSAGDSEELRLILDSVPALIAYIDARETYVLVNRSYYEWFELPRTAIVGRTVRDILGEPAYATILPHVRAALAGERVTYEAELEYVSGRRHIEASYVPHLADDGSVLGFVAIVRDTTEAHRNRETTRFLAQASVALGASLDLAATLQALTRLAVPQLGTWCSIYLLRTDDQSGALDLVAVSHVDPDGADRLREIHHRWPPDPTATIGLHQILRDGKTRLVPHVDPAVLRGLARDPAHEAALLGLGVTAWILTPLAIHGRVFGSISFGLADPDRRYDPADVALVEELARRAAVAIDNARLYDVARQERARAEAANHAKDLFLSTLSHELRTPLTAILGWTRLLRTPGLPDDRRERGLETIERNARAQVAIIEDILDISRIVAGKLRLDRRPVDLVALAEATLDSVRPTAEAREIHLTADLDPRVGPVDGDPERLQQIIWNLLSNAVKFTPRGGSVTLHLTAARNHAELRVVDTGQGIDPAFLPHVFDRFRQADASTTRAHGGLGLGLAIVRHLVQLHGGTIDAASDGPDRGATFRVRLPLAPVPAHAEAPPRAPAGLEHPPDLDGLRVLLVDDDPDARELLASALADCEVAVTAVAGVAEALAALAADTFDVVVSDIAMPHADGYALIQQLRALPHGRGSTPAIALTAHARVEDRTRALVAGFDRHVAKPIDLAELLLTLADLCGRLPPT